MNQPVLDLIEPSAAMELGTKLEPLARAQYEQQSATLPALQGQVMPAAPVTPADLLRIAMERDDKDIDRLERLMAMDERYRESQERERQREATLAFRRDFAGFRGENVVVPKSKHVDRGRAGSFFQAEFDVICQMLSPALARHGFGFRHDMRFGTRPAPTAEDPNNVIGWVFVTCYLEHRDGHFEKLELDGPPDEQSANTPVQNMQATASFLKRQSLLAITGTATGGEDDESRMRRRSAAGNDPADSTPPADMQRLIDAGLAASEGGMEKLNAWWAGLTEPQRNQLQPHFGGMRADARKADAAKGRK